MGDRLGIKSARDNAANDPRNLEKHREMRRLIRRVEPVIVYADGITPYQPDMVLLKGVWGFKIGAVAIVVKTAKEK